jgi:predicted ATP-dependent endonuclease of OLD family
MKIRHFHGEKVHGYLGFDITFKPDLTFLTGINGSGKTSAVRAITALLAPSVRDLADIAYDALSVTVEHEGSEITIKSQRSEDEIRVSCSGATEVLKVPVLKFEAYESRLHFVERERDFYRQLEAINGRNRVLVAIEQLPTPMFLDLERRHQAGTRQGREPERLHRRIAPANPLAGSLVVSLGDAQGLAEYKYRQLLAARAQLTDELKQEIILTAFELGAKGGLTQRLALPSPAVQKQIEQNEQLVPGALSRIGISEERVEQTVKPFFERVRAVAKQLPSGRRPTTIKAIDEATFKNLQEWSALQPQVTRIDQLVGLIEKYNAKVQSTFEPIRRYLNSVNGFLSDSGKGLSFDTSGNLQVEISDDPKPRPITALSSGERQVVVILTHLAFNRQAKRANILIIDEPELSLHLRWQELFVDSVTGASPGVQLILATHSPSIIKGRLDNCVDVQEARRS